MPTTLEEVVELGEFDAKVPEAFRDAYENVGGKMRLLHSGVSPLSKALDTKKEELRLSGLKVTELEAARDDALKQSLTAAETLRKYEADRAADKHGKTGDEYKADVDAAAAVKSKNDVERIQKLLDTSEADKSEAESKFSELQTDVATKALRLALEKRALKSECFQESADIVADLAEKAGFTSLNGDGEPVALNGDGQPIKSTTKNGDLDLDECLASLKTARPMLWPAKSGTGSRQRQGSGGTRAGGSQLLKDMTREERAKRIGQIGLDAYTDEVRDQSFSETEKVATS